MVDSLRIIVLLQAAICIAATPIPSLFKKLGYKKISKASTSGNNEIGSSASDTSFGSSMSHENPQSSGKNDPLPWDKISKLRSTAFSGQNLDEEELKNVGCEIKTICDQAISAYTKPSHASKIEDSMLLFRVIELYHEFIKAYPSIAHKIELHVDWDEVKKPPAPVWDHKSRGEEELEGYERRLIFPPRRH